MTDKSNGWHVSEMATHIAIHPDYEDGHVISTECWCQPIIETQHPDTGELHGLPVVRHNDVSQQNGSKLAMTDIKDDA